MSYPAEWLAANITKPPTLWSDEWTTPNSTAIDAKCGKSCTGDGRMDQIGLPNIFQSTGAANRLKRMFGINGSAETVALGVNGARDEA